MDDDETPLTPAEVEELIRNSGFANPATRRLIERVPEEQVTEMLRRLDAEKDEQEKR